MMIDQYSPQILGSAVGKPIKSPSIHKTAGGREYSKHNPTLSVSFPLRRDWSGKVQVVPSLHRGNLSVNVKIINKIHIVTVLSAVKQHGNHSSASDDCCVLLDAEKPGEPTVLSYEMLLLNMLGGPGKYRLI